MSLVESNGPEGFLDGSEIKPREFTKGEYDLLVQNDEFIEWKKTDRIVKAWIISTISESFLGLVIGSNTANEF